MADERVLSPSNVPLVAVGQELPQAIVKGRSFKVESDRPAMADRRVAQPNDNALPAVSQGVPQAIVRAQNCKLQSTRPTPIIRALSHPVQRPGLDGRRFAASSDKHTLAVGQGPPQTVVKGRNFKLESRRPPPVVRALSHRVRRPGFADQRFPAPSDKTTRQGFPQAVAKARSFKMERKRPASLVRTLSHPLEGLGLSEQCFRPANGKPVAANRQFPPARSKSVLSDQSIPYAAYNGRTPPPANISSVLTDRRPPSAVDGRRRVLQRRATSPL